VKYAFNGRVENNGPSNKTETKTTNQSAGKIRSDRRKKNLCQFESRSQLDQTNIPLKKKKIVTPAPPKEFHPKKEGSAKPLSAYW
jgi:hypothetical protein